MNIQAGHCADLSPLHLQDLEAFKTGFESILISFMLMKQKHSRRVVSDLPFRYCVFCFLFCFLNRTSNAARNYFNN